MAHAKFLEKEGKQPPVSNTSHRRELLRRSECWDFFFFLRAHLVGAVQRTVLFFFFYVQLNTVTNFHNTNYTINLQLLV